MNDTSFLAIGLYLHASVQYEDYELLLSWAQALIILSPGTWPCVVLEDLNRNPGWVAVFPRAPPYISELFDRFILDASLTRAEFTNISPTCVGSQGWSNMLDYILLRMPISPPRAYIHSFSPFPSNIFPSPSLCHRVTANRNLNYGKPSGATIFLRRYPQQCVNVSTHVLLSTSHPTRRIRHIRNFFILFRQAYRMHRMSCLARPETSAPPPVWSSRNSAL